MVTKPPTSTEIKCPQCSLPTVKPSTVLYGRDLPKQFFQLLRTDLIDCELMLIMGTSLTVYPSAKLPSLLKPEVPKVVIDMNRVGELEYENKPDSNIWLQGKCDSTSRSLIEACGWIEDFQSLLPDELTSANVSGEGKT